MLVTVSTALEAVYLVKKKTTTCNVQGMTNQNKYTGFFGNVLDLTACFPSRMMVKIQYNDEEKKMDQFLTGKIWWLLKEVHREGWAGGLV